AVDGKRRVSDESRDEALASALVRRLELWRAATGRAERLASTRARDPDEAWRAIDDYRILARDLASARRLMPDSRAREYLEGAYALSHGALHRSGTHLRSALWSLLRDQLPEATAALRPHIAWVSLLFVLSAGCGFWLVHTYPDLI